MPRETLAPAFAPPDERPYLIERVGEAAVVQLYADGFDGLAPTEKVLVWHLYQAAIAGRDIYYDQRYAHALEMRDLLEAILEHPGGIAADVLDAVTRYAKLFWINTGPYNNLTARKFVPECRPDAFRAAVVSAAAAGARLPLRADEDAGRLADRLLPIFFDGDRDPVVTCKTPGPGADLLEASANNLYVDVRMADLEAFDERYPLNSRLVRRDGALEEEVYRIGGRYSQAIDRIVSHLEEAARLAPPAMARALEALVRFYRTGEAADRRAYDIAWFEDHMPWDPRYRRPQVTGVTARAIDVVIETGDSGPITPVGINLPNDQELRETYGSKSVSLSNVAEAYETSTPMALRTEFAWDDAEVTRATTWGAIAS